MLRASPPTPDPPAVQELVRYAVTMMMVDAEQAMVVGRLSRDGREYLQIRTVSGETFDLFRPKLSASEEKELRDGCWNILSGE